MGLIISSAQLLKSAPSCFPSDDRPVFVSGDCDDSSCDRSSGLTALSTFFKPRSITSDLTYRNNMTFFERFRGAESFSFFTADLTILFQENVKGSPLGSAFFGTNPLTIAEQGSPIYSAHLGLGSFQPEGFSSTIRLSPKREVFALLPQLLFNGNESLPGLWFDLACALVRVKHHLGLSEQVLTPGDIDDLKTIIQALDELELFPTDRTHTGLDDIEVRAGYIIPYCEDDMLSGYVVGRFPTGSCFDNSRWFQPLVGSRNGAVGAGLMFDCTLSFDEFTTNECLFMAELKYLYNFDTVDTRQFDLKNGPLSRFMLVVPEDDHTNPLSAVPLLRQCVIIEPFFTVEFWMGLHYVYCNWGFEATYNLWFREQETIRARPFFFPPVGIYDMTRCADTTSHSTARISDAFFVGTADTSFVRLDSNDVLLSSGAVREARSHTISGTVSYSNEWCNWNYSVALSARYEFAGNHRHTSTLENWGLFGKISVSC